jgi:hypothetical protein
MVVTASTLSGTRRASAGGLTVVHRDLRTFRARRTCLIRIFIPVRAPGADRRGLST